MDQHAVIDTQGIHHVSINVKDVDAAVDFYVNVLNLKRKDRPDLGFPGAWLQAGEQEIHLLGIDSGTPVKEQHFAFAVANADAVHKMLVDSGFQASEIQFQTFAVNFLPAPAATIEFNGGFNTGLSSRIMSPPMAPPVALVCAKPACLALLALCAQLASAHNVDTSDAAFLQAQSGVEFWPYHLAQAHGHGLGSPAVSRRVVFFLRSLRVAIYVSLSRWATMTLILVMFELNLTLFSGCRYRLIRGYKALENLAQQRGALCP